MDEQQKKDKLTGRYVSPLSAAKPIKLDFGVKLRIGESEGKKTVGTDHGAESSRGCDDCGTVWPLLGEAATEEGCSEGGSKWSREKVRGGDVRGCSGVMY